MTATISWLIFGIAAIVTAGLNICFFRKPDWSNCFRFLSLFFTALTVCAFYWQETGYVLKKDWSALMDIMPVVSRLLWVCVITSIVINSITFFRKNN